MFSLEFEFLKKKLYDEFGLKNKIKIKKADNDINSIIKIKEKKLLIKNINNVQSNKNISIEPNSIEFIKFLFTKIIRKILEIKK